MKNTRQENRASKLLTNVPGLFEGAAPYYSRYRPEYPAEVIEMLIRRFNLSALTHVLDLGCGTGQIAIPMAKLGIPVHAVDPDVEMLAEGMRAEQRAAVRGIAWIRGEDASIIQLHLPLLSLCTMGASFHWMDREQILRTLDSKIVEGGGIALLSGGNSVWSGRGTGWLAVAKEVVVEFLGSERRAAGGIYNHPTDRHEIVLARSAFGHLEQLSFSTQLELRVEQIVGLQLSSSYASPAQLGVRTNEFKNVLSERLLALEPSGVFRTELTTELLVATR